MTGPAVDRRTVVDRLARAGCVAAADEAAALLAAGPDPATLDGWLARREAGEPLAWIVGSVDFGGVAVRIDRGVYVPRHETVELARRAAACLAPGGSAADLCTGSGAVARYLQATVPGAGVVGVDVDRLAVRCARANGVPAFVGDLGAPLRSRHFNVVTAVAPYVPTGALAYLPADVLRYEPHGALDGGVDGLSVVRRVVDAAANLLRPGGHLLIELGGEQNREVASDLDRAGFASPATWEDEDGDLRGLTAALRR